MTPRGKFKPEDGRSLALQLAVGLLFIIIYVTLLMLADMLSVDQQPNSYERQNLAYSNPLFGVPVLYSRSNGDEWPLKPATNYAAVIFASLLALIGAGFLLGRFGDAGIPLGIVLWVLCLWISYHAMGGIL